MSGKEQTNRERARHLMMAALDGEIETAERAEMDRLLRHDAELNEEWERMRRLKEVTATMTLRKPPDEVWGRYWSSVYNRLERGIGWILMTLGCVVLISWGVWHVTLELVGDASIPVVIKVAIFATALGGVLLLFSVLREKLFTRRHDAYKEIER